LPADAPRPPCGLLLDANGATRTEPWNPVQ
jgi:hypothetical protein